MTQILESGQVLIGRYEILRYLNEGGMQEVYICHDRALDRQAVVKTPKAGVRDKRFRRGAEMGARINHHNIAATFDYYEDQTLTFIVEEYIDGLDLSYRLKNEFSYMDPALAAHVIHNIARALYDAHRMGICHRDLKPGNIMTSRDPSLELIKLTDFGIAKLAESELEAEMADFERDESTLTSSNTLLGAVPYLAPECWADWRRAGQPMDIWALGCIAYQLLTGSPPFGFGRTAIREVTLAEQRGRVELTPPPLFGRSPATARLESDLLTLINSCLVIAPERRPKAQDVIEFCGTWLYATSPRRIGTVASFGVPYAGGGRSKTGEIRESERGSMCFYHRSEFYSREAPQVGQLVNMSVYPGHPRPRAAPVLPIKQPIA